MNCFIKYLMCVKYRPLRQEYNIYSGEVQSQSKVMAEFGLHLIGDTEPATVKWHSMKHILARTRGGLERTRLEEGSRIVTGTVRQSFPKWGVCALDKMIPWGEFLKSSLRYNSHCNQFTHLKCTLHFFYYIHRAVWPLPQFIFMTF